MSISEPDPFLPKSASEFTITANTAASSIPESNQDFDDSTKNRKSDDVTPPDILRYDPASATDYVWRFSDYNFEREASGVPPTVNPSLWRQASLNNINGLFQVCDGIYQVRGYDLSNMTIIETSNTGLLIIDPLISAECAEAGLKLYRTQIDKTNTRRVKAIIYTHSHVDHFGGVRGVLKPEYCDFNESTYMKTQKPLIIAPDGFLEHAASENVYSGHAMFRRAQYMYGAYLQASVTGQVDAGLGKTQSTGTPSLIAPNVTIPNLGSETKTLEDVDGITIEFQPTPGTEAPSEFNIYFPKWNALCLAENATHNIHNILTPRGALVRDSLAWSKYLQRTICLYIDNNKTNVAFAQHHWPIFDKEQLKVFLCKQRDMYRYLHDQTLRYLNKGYTGIQIAEIITKLPPVLDKEWYCRGYYGTINNNVKAIYQRYMGWFDGNPSNFWALPPEEVAPRYFAYMGGLESILAKAQADFNNGEYRWVSEVLKHVVALPPAQIATLDQDLYRKAVFLLADSLEQIGYQCESGPWRNFFLMGTKELREKIKLQLTGEVEQPLAKKGSDMSFIAGLTLEMCFDSLGITIDSAKAENKDTVTTCWHFTDLKRVVIATIENSALNYTEYASPPGVLPNDRICLTRDTFNYIIVNASTIDGLIESGALQIHGKQTLLNLKKFFGMMDVQKVVDFPIVTPQRIPPVSKYG